MARSTDKRIRGRKLQAIREAHFRLHPLCVRCVDLDARPLQPATELDHIVALCNGGRDVESNRQGLCPAHHLEKTAQDMGRKYRPRVRIGADGYQIQEPSPRR